MANTKFNYIRRELSEEHTFLHGMKSIAMCCENSIGKHPKLWSHNFKYDLYNGYRPRPDLVWIANNPTCEIRLRNISPPEQKIHSTLVLRDSLAANLWTKLHPKKVYVVNGAGLTTKVFQIYDTNY